MQLVLRLRVFIIICLAVILITTAVIFSVLRAALPYATGYKNEIQQELSAQIGLPVEINSIDAAIHWFSPRLKLIGVSVYDEKNKVPLFNFREAFVELDVIASIVRGEIIVDDVGLIGADLSIEKLSGDKWLLQGIEFGSDGESELPEQFLYMLQNADYLLHDSNIYYQDHTGEKLNLNLLDVNIDVRNNFNNHDIKFSMNLLESYGRDLAVVANLHGDIDSLEGDVYIDANELNISQWNNKLNISDTFQTDGVVDIKLWVTVEGSKIKTMFTQLAAKNLQLVNNETGKSWRTKYLSTNLRFVDDEGLRSVAVSDFYYGEELKPAWVKPVTVLAHEDDENYYLSADFLRLQDLPVIAEVFLNERQLKDLEKIKAYHVKADVYNLNLLLPKEMAAQNMLENASLEFSLIDFSMINEAGDIDISGIDGTAHYANMHADIDIQSIDAKVILNNLFREPLFAETIRGKVNLDYIDNNWRLASDRLQIKTEHINTFTRMDARISSAEEIFVDAQTDFYEADGKYTSRYLPVGIMSPGLVKWLDMAITDAYVPSGSFLLHGKLKDFPYKDNNGVFQVVFPVQDVKMQFLENWPSLIDTSATVKFNNQSLQVTDVKGKTLNAALSGGLVDIKNLAEPHLTVITDAHAGNDDIQSYIWNSALDDVLGDTMRLLQFEGDSDLKLKIDVPLYKEEVDVAIDGHIDFINTELYYPALGYEITAINGALDFTGDSVFADSMNAVMHGEDVTINAFTRDGKTGREVVFHLDAVMGADYLLQRYEWIPVDWFSGKSLWAVDLELPYDPVDYLVSIKANSSLENVVLQVSDKVSKSGNSKVDLSLDIKVLENQGLHVKAKAGLNDPAGTGDKDIFDVFASRDGKHVWNFDIDSKYIAGQGAFTEGLGKETQVKLDLANIDLHALFYTKDNTGSKPFRPRNLPPLNWDAEKVIWGDWVFTDVRVETNWHEHGMLINTLAMKGPAMTFDARGTWLTSWRDVHETVLEGTITSSNIGQTLTGLGFERSINRGQYKAEFNSKWPAEPYALSWANMKGKTTFEMQDGEILEADPGTGGRLLGLLNIFKLTNRLTLDFDDVTREGFSFDSINGEFEFVNGDGSLKNFDVSAPAADINMFGSVGMVKRDYGLLMRVKPHTDTLTFAGGTLLGGVVVGAGLALIQKIFDLGVIGHNVYSITGSWDDPVIEKIIERTQDTAEDDDEF